MKKPLALKKGDTIGVMAPSSALTLYERYRLRQGVALLRKQGFKVAVHPQTFLSRDGQAGTPQEKADALHDLYRNPEIKAIFAATGGTGAINMLDRLDYGLIKAHPKILMGYSDVTALLLSVHEHTGQATFHGPTLTSLGGSLPKGQLSQCFGLLAGKPAPADMGSAKTLTPGKAHGPLYGGNLTLFSQMVDKGWRPPDGAILFFEDVRESVAYYGRKMQKLKAAGILSRAAGLAFGAFNWNTGPGNARIGFTIKSAIKKATDGLDIPVVFNVPFGHGRNLYTFPMGAPATVKAARGQTPSLTLDGPAVRL